MAQFVVVSVFKHGMLVPKPTPTLCHVNININTPIPDTVDDGLGFYGIQNSLIITLIAPCGIFPTN